MTMVAGLASAGHYSLGVAHQLAAAWIEAQPGDYDPSTGKGPEWGKAAPAGLLVWLFLGAALFLLVKSMNRHIKKVKLAEQEGAAQSAEQNSAAAAEAGAADTAEGEISAAEAANSARAADRAAGAGHAADAAGAGQPDD